LLGPERPDILSVDDHRPVCGGELVSQPFQERALPRTVRTDEGRDGPTAGGNRLPVDDGLVGPGVL